MLTPRLPATFKKLDFNARLGQLFLPILLIALLGGCASEPPFKPTDDQASYNKPYKVNGKTYYPLVSASGYREKGLASWYGSESGNRTAMGRRFNPKDLTAAHKTLPLPCKVRVTNLRNGRHIDVEVNDRGPFNDDRLIDLSHGAAKQIGMRGTTEVEVEYLEN